MLGPKNRGKKEKSEKCQVVVVFFVAGREVINCANPTVIIINPISHVMGNKDPVKLL